MSSSINIRIGKCRLLIPQIHRLALNVYKDRYVSSLSMYYSLYDKCPESFVVAVDPRTNRVLGYIISVPLDYNYFQTTKESNYCEDDLTIDKILPYKEGNNSVYLFSIVTNPDCDNRVGALTALAKAYKEQMRDFLKQEVFVTEATALALSSSGQKLCLGLGMEDIGVNEHGRVFYNSKFYKLFIDDDSKKEIVRSLIIRRESIKRAKLLIRGN